MPNEIPKQHYAENADITPLDLKQFMQPSEAGETLSFKAVMEDGRTLEEALGLSCSADGIVSGTVLPNIADEGSQQVLVVASSDRGMPVISQVDIHVHAGAEAKVAADDIVPEKSDNQENVFANDLLDIDDIIPETHVNATEVSKQDHWQAISDDIKIPSAQEIAARPVSRADLYYLLGRYATLTLWNADVLEPASQLKLITLEGVSDSFHVFDRGSSLAASPKDLFAYDRSPLHAIKTAQAMMREVLRRGWTVEAAGYDKMLKAAWVEGQRVELVTKKETKFLHYQPTQRTIDYFNVHVKPRANQLGAPYVSIT